MTVTESSTAAADTPAAWPPTDRAFSLTAMLPGPRSSSTVLLPRENLLHAGGLAGRPTGAGPAVGDAAPDFRIVAADGTTRTLRDFVGRPLVLALYRALTPMLVCPYTLRAMKELTDTYDDFAAAGIELAVVFPTTVEGGAEILAAHELAWPVYTDPTWDVFRAYGSGHVLFGPIQMYAIVDGDGVVRWLWRSEPSTPERPVGVESTPLPSEVLAAAAAAL